jgi:hypothetical protein
VLFARAKNVLVETVTIVILWIFFLITAALVTVCTRHSSFSAVLTILLQEQFSNLKWCRSHHKECRILETIKAFGWICWGFFSILLVVALCKLVFGDRSVRSNHGTGPATTQIPTTNTATATHDHASRTVPATQATQGAKQTTTAHTTTNTAHTAQGGYHNANV